MRLMTCRAEQGPSGANGRMRQQAGPVKPSQHKQGQKRRASSSSTHSMRQKSKAHHGADIGG